jgi:N-acetylglucosamine-6-phosphate deacetylase
MDILITNCHIVSPDVEIENGAILIENNIIKKLYSEPTPELQVDKEYDAKGNYVLPGFVDIHSHGAMGFDVSDCSAEELHVIAQAKLKEGVTTWLPTTLTLPEEMLIESAKNVAAYLKAPTGPKVPGIHLEGPFVNPNCAGAQNPDYIRLPDIEEVLRIDAVSNVALISFAVEMDGAIPFAKELKKHNIVGSCAHSAATHADFAKAKEAGITQLTHFCNQMTPLHHREIGLVGTGLLDEDVLIEMICDTIHLCPDMIRLAFKVKNIENIALITDSVAPSGLPDGNYSLGGLGIVVKDEAARLTSNGALAGSTLKYNLGLRNINNILDMPLKELIKTTSFNQAQRLGLTNIGKIEEGYAADIVILNSDFSVEKVFIDGKCK